MKLLQVPPRQHGCPDPPQVSQVPSAQAKPVSQRSPPQQGSPDPPQSTQVFALSQSVVSLHRSPIARQTPPEGEVVSQHAWLQVSPLQQG